ncbi:hypothetical protein NQ318_013636 [Aromia moschata]|uniref:MADF domain-containing protein n=1 Tax=Aromia moschata TaxID=1265417 RepID=A0AAV8XJ71_9CUCU|nr:hypothetical protein NQ318_013636 [Aromia moschata]
MASEDENYIFLNDDGTVKEGFVRDTPYLRQILEIPEVEIETEPAELEQSQDVEDVLVEKHSEVEEHWDETTAKHLLTLYLQNVDKFKNPRVKKKLLWKKIGAVLGKDASVCDKKYRNLKQHYTTLLKKNKKFHKRPIRWPFFSLFEQINSKEGFKLDEPPEIQADRAETRLDDATTAGVEVVEESNNIQRERNKKQESLRMSIVLKQEEMDIEENDVNDADLIGVATHSEEETATPRNLPEELWEKGSKKNLWKGIGTALGKDPEACNRKFRNLKHHYVTLLRKRNQFGLNNTWPFFDLFEEINRNNDFKVIEKFKFSSYPRAQAWGPRFVVVRGAPAMNAYTVGSYRWR